MSLLEYPAPTLPHELLVEQVAEWMAGEEPVEYYLPNARTQFTFRLLDGRSEHFDLEPLVDMEYSVYAPVLDEDGDMTIPLEIMRFENGATSNVLWPGESLIVRGGVRTHPEAKPIYGTVHIPTGLGIEDGALNRQTLWSRFWTPIGELTMQYPVNMSGVVRKLNPPLKARLYSDRPIPLFNETGEHVATIFNCKTAD
jgi:hypothetical protein